MVVLPPLVECAIQSLSTQANASIEIDSNVQAVSHFIGGVFPNATISVWLFNDDNSLLCCHTQTSQTQTINDRFNLDILTYGDYFSCLRLGHPVICSIDSSAIHLLPLKRRVLIPLGLQSLIDHPIVYHSTLYGTIRIELPTNVVIDSESAMEILARFSEILGSVINRRRRHDSLVVESLRRDAEARIEYQTVRDVYYYSSDAFITTSDDGLILSATPAALALFDYRLPDIYKHPITDICPSFFKVLNERRQGGSKWRLLCLTREARELKCEITRTTTSDGGAMTTWLFRDLASIEKNMLAENESDHNHDFKTGVLSTRRIYERHSDEYGLAMRTGSIFTVAFVDIDLFKSVNDKYGHEFGDIALKHVATVLAQGLREIDSIGRFGGEEFLILLPNTDANGAQIAVERLRARVEQSTLRHNGEEIVITVSCGYCTYFPGANPSKMRDLADKAMYEAKRRGRNRVAGASVPF